MDFYKYIIVGSGPAGIAAAQRLEGNDVCIVDVGDSPTSKFPYSTLDQALSSEDPGSLLGSCWEMLGNLTQPERIHTKLRAPGVNYVAQGEGFQVIDETGKCAVEGAGSYAAGGLSNAWGAQLLRYTDTDFDEAGRWPIGATELERYYTQLEVDIGIAGKADDMHGFLGHTAHMLPPAPIVPCAEYLLKKYEAKKKHAANNAFTLGRSRLALLTEDYRGYARYQFGQTEFFSTEQPGLYTARRSLEELKARGKATYLGKHKLVGYRETVDYVELDLVATSGATIKLRTHHLLLGCGTIHTAKLVLLNKQEKGRQLPFIDHPPTLLPLFIPKMFGSPLPDHSYPIQLTASLERSNTRDMISLYYPGAMLWSDLLAEIPLPINISRKLLPSLLGGMLVAQIWEKSQPQPSNYLSLREDNSVQINYHSKAGYPGLSKILAELRPLGVFSLPRLASNSPAGWGFHYAGCLPMRKQPGPYETHVDGRLWDSKRVRVIDGSVLPSLPAKNHSLTLMANASRIADEVLRCEY